MRPIVRAPLLTLAASAALLAAVTAAGAQSGTASPAGPPKSMQRWMENHEAMLDARLAGLKAGLKLTPDQETLWGPFEAAVRAFAEGHMARMQGMMERMEGDRGEMGMRPSPIDRLDRMAARLSEVGAGLHRIADAGKPLYASLDDQQRHMFGVLSREMMRMGHGPDGMSGMMGRPPRRHGDEDGPDEEE